MEEKEMAVQEFVKGDDLKKLIIDKLISAQNVKHVLQQKGILPVCFNPEDLSNLINYHLFSSQTMTYLQEVMNFDQNNLKSTVLILSPQKEFPKQDFLSAIADEFVNKSRKLNNDNSIKNIIQNESSVTLQYTHQKIQKGRIKIAEKRKVTLDVTISPLDQDSKEYKINIRHEGISDSKLFVSLLDEMFQENREQSIFRLKRITLASLTSTHKVDFFDKFGTQAAKDQWNLIDIINVTVNKDEKCIDDSESEVISNEISTSDSTDRLSGISTAILKGDGLRNNEFVKECMAKGFIFSSMCYKFMNTKDPITIVVEVNFKQIDLKINIIKTYRNEDNKEVLFQLPPDDQNFYINYFQNVAYTVYSKLIEKQKTEVNNLSELTFPK